MIHRAPFGSMERFCGVLIEHFAGRFPTRLTPTQCTSSIREEHKAYAAKVAAALGPPVYESMLTTRTTTS